MRRALIAFLAVAATLATVARASVDIVVVPKPAFPPALPAVPRSSGARLDLLSTTHREPTYTSEGTFVGGPGVPKALRGEQATIGFSQAGTVMSVYGTGLIAAFGPRLRMKYAFDLGSFGFPPRSIAPRAYGPQEVTWARQLGRTLVVQTNHLGYASDSGGRNGYLTGIDLDTGKVRWRSPALVANAESFVVTRGLIVSGYGFTAEKDWLYLTDPGTGRVRNRLALPSAPERIIVRGDRLVVRCYDAWVTARLVPD